MKLNEIFKLYMDNKITKNDKFVYMIKNYKFNIHGNYYKYIITLGTWGLFETVYDKDNKMANCGYVDLHKVKECDVDYRHIK